MDRRRTASERLPEEVRLPGPSGQAPDAAALAALLDVTSPDADKALKVGPFQLVGYWATSNAAHMYPRQIRGEKSGQCGVR